MKPSICRMVVYKNPADTFNSTDEHPAVVNRVWSDQEPTATMPVCVNLTVFPDCAPPKSRTSVYLFPDRASAEAYLKRQQQSGSAGACPVAFWPDKV